MWVQPPPRLQLFKILNDMTYYEFMWHCDHDGMTDEEIEESCIDPYAEAIWEDNYGPFNPYDTEDDSFGMSDLMPVQYGF